MIDRVAEVDGAALGVGEASVVEDLQQGVEHVGVGLLDLVEEHDRVRLAAHGLGQLAALLVADVAGRRAHQPADGVPLLVLGHVEPDDVVLGVEERLGERARQLGLADAGRPEEDERADRPAGVLDARASADDRVGDELHGLVLADHALVQDLVEAQQLLALALHQPGDRDAVQRATTSAISSSVTSSRSRRCRPACSLERSSSACEPALQLGQPAVAQLGRAVEVVVALGLLDLAPHLLELLAQGLQLADRLALGLPLRRHRVGLGAQVGELLAQRLQPLLAGRVVLLARAPPPRSRAASRGA